MTVIGFRRGVPRARRYEYGVAGVTVDERKSVCARAGAQIDAVDVMMKVMRVRAGALSIWACEAKSARDLVDQRPTMSELH